MEGDTESYPIVEFDSFGDLLSNGEVSKIRVRLFQVSSKADWLNLTWSHLWPWLTSLVPMFDAVRVMVLAVTTSTAYPNLEKWECFILHFSWAILIYFPLLSPQHQKYNFLFSGYCVVFPMTLLPFVYEKTASQPWQMASSNLAS